MTWSLAVDNGDLVLGSASFNIVSDEDKLVQDLRCALLEPAGTDDMHPDYGSYINGGTDLNGDERPSMIGLTNSTLSASLVTSEINRVVVYYQNQQLQRAKADRNAYGKTTFSRGEVLLNLDDIEADPVLDTLYVTLDITTANDTSLSMGVPVSSE